MWLIVGLGNPGSKYLFTRHNIGFMALDYLHTALQVTDKPKSEHKAQTITFTWNNEKIMTCKPQTFMNLSGESVAALMSYYKIEQDKLVVLHDELDLPFGRIKLQVSRGGGGHNGVKSVSDHLGNNDYARFRLGIGRPTTPIQPGDFVLQNFTHQEQEQLGPFLDKVVDGLEILIFQGLTKAMNTVNVKED